ncbi:MAG: Dam family site-specific DNA-(adenine-N6)-methyltransferase, partial [Ruminococcus sp.]|nr:Dam family site-specific DNA-(adenine-N6)-methyltransferase [Ruminococcus sp.]
MLTVKPFIKWAGGKGQILDIIREKYPESINRYCEPFVGGGAVLLDILANFKPEEVLINDINQELINAYIHIRNSAEDMIDSLSDMQEKFWNMNSNQQKEYFYIQRDKFNNGIRNNTYDISMAILFIFLNKTCFNGLYRVNRQGFYNVPIGSYKKPNICDPDNIRIISSLLQNVQIKCSDYSKCSDFIDENTFVYIDPPYRPLNKTSSFNSYNENKFGDKQQIQLAQFLELLSKKGAKIVASNSDPKNIDKD